MRPGARPILFVALAACAPACSAIAGLDQITESACAPYCGVDEGGADDLSLGEASALDRSDATSEAGREAEEAAADSGDEPGSSPDASTPDSAQVDSGAPEDSGTPDDSGTPEDSGAPEVGARDAAGDAVSPPDAADASEAGPCGTVFFHDAFDGNTQGWTLDTSWTIADTCASPPAPQKGNPDPKVDHTTGAAGGIVGAYVCGNNPTGATSAARYATSPAVDVASAPSVFLTFYRWLNSDALTYMTSTVDVYDGASWVNVYTNPSGSGNLVADAAWTRESYDVTAYKNAAFRVRFGYAVVNAGVYEMSCWNVDDVALSTVACP